MDKIRSIRKKELKYQRMAAFLNAGFYFTFTCTPFLVNVTSLHSVTRAVTQTTHAIPLYDHIWKATAADCLACYTGLLFSQRERLIAEYRVRDRVASRTLGNVPDLKPSRISFTLSLAPSSLTKRASTNQSKIYADFTATYGWHL